MCVVTWICNQKLIEDLFKTVLVIRAIAHTGRVTGSGGGQFNGHWAPVIHKSNRRLAVSNTGLRFQYTGAGPGPGHSRDNISISHSRSICASISCLYMRDYPLLWQLQLYAVHILLQEVWGILISKCCMKVSNLCGFIRYLAASRSIYGFLSILWLLILITILFFMC